MAASVKRPVRVVDRDGRRLAQFADEVSCRPDQRLEIPITAHGTWDRWRLHVALGQAPCVSCAVAAADHWRAVA